MSTINRIRSALFIPADRSDFIAKAHSRGADAIILDLEDAVAETNKQAARDNVISASNELVEHGLVVLVRINSTWRMAVRDLEASVSQNVHCIVVPKSSSPAHVQAIDEIVTELEVEKGLPIGHTRLLAYIESPAALAQVQQIAAASSRLLGVSLGTEDFSAEIGAVPNSETLYYPSQQIVYAAYSAGIQPFGFAGSIASFNDMDAFRKTIKRSRDMGFRGACCIHPKQVTVLNEEFTPSKQEVAHAQAILACFDQAKAQGRGAVAYKGEMIDAPVVARALAIVNSVS